MPPSQSDDDRADYERVIAGLMEHIAAGEPGDKLPSIADLAREFNVGQTTVKTALAILRDRGAIRTKRGSGTYIPAPLGHPSGVDEAEDE